MPVVWDQHRRHSPGGGSRDMTEDPIPGLLASALERPSPSPGRGGRGAAAAGSTRAEALHHLPPPPSARTRGGPAGGGGGRGLPASRRQRQHRGRVGTGGLAVAGPPGAMGGAFRGLGRRRRVAREGSRRRTRRPAARAATGRRRGESRPPATRAAEDREKAEAARKDLGVERRRRRAIDQQVEGLERRAAELRTELEREQRSRTDAEGAGGP